MKIAFGLELLSRPAVAGVVFLGSSRRIGTTDLRNVKRNVAAFLPRNRVAEAFHEIVKNLNFFDIAMRGPGGSRSETGCCPLLRIIYSKHRLQARER